MNKITGWKLLSLTIILLGIVLSILPFIRDYSIVSSVTAFILGVFTILAGILNYPAEEGKNGTKI